MCWEDVKIGQSEPYIVRTVTVDNAAPVDLLQVNAMRSVIIICTPSADGIRVLPNTDPTATAGLLIDSAAAGEKTLRLQEVGRMVQDKWRAIATGAAPVTVVVIEVTLSQLGPTVGGNANVRSQ